MTTLLMLGVVALIVIALAVWTAFRMNGMLKTAAEINRKLLASNEKIYAQARTVSSDTSRALAAIHTLVNSNLATAQERELSAHRDTLTSLREVARLKSIQGIQIPAESVEVIAQLENRIAAMATAQLDQRVKTDIADIQLRGRKESR
jgi:hypothetical protein